MRPNGIHLITLSVFFFVIFGCVFDANPGQTIRKPVVAGHWYPEAPDELRKLLSTLTDKAKQTAVSIPANRPLRALILPHASPWASGWTAAHAYFVLKSAQFSKVIIIGPDHRVGFTNGSISTADIFQTPLGATLLHGEATILRENSALFNYYSGSDRHEHSIETVLIFLQHYLGEFRLIPIVLGYPSAVAQISAAIDAIVNPDTLLVVSSDLSHYQPYQRAIAKDRQTITHILQLDSEKSEQCDDCACGKIPILVLLDLARRHRWEPVLLHYSNSGETVGGLKQVVGYAAIAFYGGGDMNSSKSPDQPFDRNEGEQLIKLARRVIADRLGIKDREAIPDPVHDAFDDQCYQTRCGTFVTLEKGGQLRGCIGNLSSNQTVVDGIKENAINAAFYDPRFSPLSTDEFNQVKISVSILSEPKPLKYKDSNDLLAKLRVNVDGVIIRKGSRSATFLPQVWEQLPQPEAFLSHLCMKASLPPASWQNSQLEVLTYQVQYFEER